MYYYTGKTANRIVIDKNVNIAGDVAYFINKGAVSDGYNGYHFKEAKECFYLPKDQSVTIDEVPVINTGPSGYFTKEQMVSFTEDCTVSLGKLTQAPEIFDFTDYFEENYDSRPEVIEGGKPLPVYWANDLFSKIVVDKLNIIQYLLVTPIRNIQIGKAIYRDHIFLFSTVYTLNTQNNIKLYLLPN